MDRRPLWPLCVTCNLGAASAKALQSARRGCKSWLAPFLMDNPDWFAAVLPLPFKALALVALGVYLWHVVARVNYRRANINTLQLLALSYSKHSYAHLDGHLPSDGAHATTTAPDFKENRQLVAGIWHTFTRVALLTAGGWVLYHLLRWGVAAVAPTQGAILVEAIPIATILAVLAALFAPTRQPLPGSYRAFTTLKRVGRGAINSATMRTNDILLADLLVSYARVLNDFSLYGGSLLWPTMSATAWPRVALEALTLALPTLLRMRQCWHEFSVTAQRQHLANMAKYATALGPVAVTVMVRRTLAQMSLLPQDASGQSALIAHLALLNRWWYAWALVNAAYSVFWDIRMDWGLARGGGGVEGVLRPRDTLIGPPAKYFAIIACEVVLRFLWVLKFWAAGEHDTRWPSRLGLFLYGGDASQLGYTVVQVLEIVRRWLWCFLKLEADWLKMGALGIEMKES